MALVYRHSFCCLACACSISDDSRMLQRSVQNINGFERLQRNLLRPRDIHLRPLPRLTSPCKPASINNFGSISTYGPKQGVLL
ncbi:hypothetical protein LB506_008752 [Fusarium annulatum]|nr:hypothetical protein LB506_008752 [Fusarium annulatum]